jgi:hypothetical protein
MISKTSPPTEKIKSKRSGRQRSGAAADQLIRKRNSGGKEKENSSWKRRGRVTTDSSKGLSARTSASNAGRNSTRGLGDSSVRCAGSSNNSLLGSGDPALPFLRRVFRQLLFDKVHDGFESCPLFLFHRLHSLGRCEETRSGLRSLVSIAAIRRSCSSGLNCARCRTARSASASAASSMLRLFVLELITDTHSTMNRPDESLRRATHLILEA